ncbi:NADH dehydrogenase [Cutibacterium avidum]|uniref:NADH-quinone oxidoreductase subunit D-related protein n=1 Tax=Cutibacterium avidum TaxID=33010 RepID=UPI00083E7F16|nr:NADH dehydrogenase [Cutibacterium avidum]AOG29310.1 NADH dehydrogenase [Cutibacterium avidum]
MMLATPAETPDGEYEVIRLDLGRLHPTRPGLVRIATTVEDGLITSAQVNAGNLHRGDEKLFEVRDYRQIPMLASRHDWTSPFIGETGAAHVVEEAMGITVPIRVTWIRTLLAEFSRITSHLTFLSWVGHHCDDPDLENEIASTIERSRTIWQSCSGNRIHPMITRIGGLEIHPGQEWCPGLREWLDEADALLPRLRADLEAAEGIREVAVIPTEMVDAYGLSGPVSRTSGVDMDIRKGLPVYDELSWPETAAEPLGDAYSRLTALCDDVTVSSSLCRQVLDRLPTLDGPLATRLPTAIKVPRGRTWTALEAPWGRAGYLLESRGGTTPWRMALRTPTFANVQALEAILPGTRTDDVEAAIASLGWTLGDLDK